MNPAKSLPLIRRASWFLPMALLLVACATGKKSPEEEKPKSAPPKLVGIIASVPREDTFVLIQSYGPWESPAGTILTTRGENNRTANLIFTGEKLGRFAAADIQSGSVEKGDAVYAQHVPKPDETPMEAAMPIDTDTAADTPSGPSPGTGDNPKPPIEPALPE